jgi:DivIVA domain-containing protein
VPPTLRKLRPGPCTGPEVPLVNPPGEALDALASGRAPDVTSDDVHTVVFAKPPMGRRGYDEDAVDALLDQVESALRGAPATGIELNGRPLGE